MTKRRRFHRPDEPKAEPPLTLTLEHSGRATFFGRGAIDAHCASVPPSVPQNSGAIEPQHGPMPFEQVAESAKLAVWASVLAFDQISRATRHVPSFSRW